MSEAKKNNLVFYIVFHLIIFNDYIIQAQFHAYRHELYEGSSCVMEDNSQGKCVPIIACPKRIEEIQRGRRGAAAHCAWKDETMEIVCCPLNKSTTSHVDDKLSYLDYEESCNLENGKVGYCLEIPKCPTRLKEVMEGKRYSTLRGRCGFNGTIEIVCCPERGPNVNYKPNIGNIRPAEKACRQYDSELVGDDGLSTNLHIFNGQRAANGEFPYMVALGYRNDNNPSDIKYNCGGTLISFEHILTAAHCFSNINNLVPVEVRLGSVNLNDNSNLVQRIPVGKITVHPDYRRGYNYHDIAIIKLSRPITYSKTVMPICLQTAPIANLQQLVSMRLIVTGWGLTSFDNEGSNELQKTPSLEFVDRAECSKHYSDFSRLPRGLDEGMICVIDRNVTRRSDACQGDSGGPLLVLSMVTSTVIGVTSFGQSCGSLIPAIYTSVYSYLNWIEQIVWPNEK